MPMYNLIECSENYVNTSGRLWQCCRDEPDEDIANSESFKFELALANNSNNAGTVSVEIIVPLKYLSNF